jgi:hypothetical protein
MFIASGGACDDAKRGDDQEGKLEEAGTYPETARAGSHLNHLETS